MSGSKMTIKPKPKPTDLFCEDCLEEVTILQILNPSVEQTIYRCKLCQGKFTREKVLTFDEMTEAKFERVKHRNLNQLKKDMRP